MSIPFADPFLSQAAQLGQNIVPGLLCHFPTMYLTRRWVCCRTEGVQEAAVAAAAEVALAEAEQQARVEEQARLDAASAVERNPGGSIKVTSVCRPLQDDQLSASQLRVAHNVENLVHVHPVDKLDLEARASPIHLHPPS